MTQELSTAAGENVRFQLVATPDRIHPGGQVILSAEITHRGSGKHPLVAYFSCLVGTGTFEAHNSRWTMLNSPEGHTHAEAVVIEQAGRLEVTWRPLANAPANFVVRLTADLHELSRAAPNQAAMLSASRREGIGPHLGSQDVDIRIEPEPATSGPQPRQTIVQPQPLPVQLTRARVEPTPDQALWTIIRLSTEALSYENYEDYLDRVFCEPGLTGPDRRRVDRLAAYRHLPFVDTDPYRLLKVATEVFVQLNCGVFFDQDRLEEVLSISGTMADEKLRIGRAIVPGDVRTNWQTYIGRDHTLPYLDLVRRSLQPWGTDGDSLDSDPATLRLCEEVLREKFTNPCLVELIWNYWHEEGMLVQSMNAITYRFQNRERGQGRDPLAAIEIDPLRPLNNFLWGYIQDEDHRLSVPRRAYEYDHQYGLAMYGKAVPEVRGADSRSRFIEAFHNLLYLCSIFFKEDDDTTVVADGFPILNALREVHLLLTQGAHNQYRDLPWTARIEMLMEEWFLGRPQFRELLPRRIMVDYPEQWMHSVEAMKNLQGWASTDVLHFRDLGVNGERVLLSIRFGSWTTAQYPEQAANWARYFRSDVQRYIHAYRAVTGADLSDHVDATMPGLLMRARMSQQSRRGGSPMRGPAASPRLAGSPTARALGLPIGQATPRETSEWRMLEAE